MGTKINRHISFHNEHINELPENRLNFGDSKMTENSMNEGKSYKKEKRKKKNDNNNGGDSYNGNNDKNNKKVIKRSNSFDKMYEDLNHHNYIINNRNNNFDNIENNKGNNYERRKKKSKTYVRAQNNGDNDFNKKKQIRIENNIDDKKKRKKGKGLSSKNKGSSDNVLPNILNKKEEIESLNQSKIIEISYYSSDENIKKNNLELNKNQKLRIKKYNSFIKKKPVYNNQKLDFYNKISPLKLKLSNNKTKIPKLLFNNPKIKGFHSFSNKGIIYKNKGINELIKNKGLSNNNLGLLGSYSNNNILHKYKLNLYPRLDLNKRSYEFSNMSNQPKKISKFPNLKLFTPDNKYQLPLKIGKYNNYSIKDLIYDEFQRHKTYLDENEQKCVEEINYNNFLNCDNFKYSKSILLHQKEITSICAITLNIKKICYATGSNDRTIKLWKENFECILSKENLKNAPLVLLQYRTRYLLSAEGIYIKIYDLNSSNLVLYKTLRDHILEIQTILILDKENSNQFNLKIISAGNDKILRMWDILDEKVIKYFEGHKDSVANIQYVGNEKNVIISMGVDKCFIIWDIIKTNIIVIFNNYFTSTCLLGTSFGFCCGSYDNKIRFYDKNYNMIKCIVGNFYDSDNFLMITNTNLIFTTAENELIIIDIDTDKIFSFYSGLKCDIRKIIKSYDWDIPEKNRNNKLNGIKYKNILTIGNDGYVYIWECYEYLNKILPDDESNNESFDSLKRNKQNE